MLFLYKKGPNLGVFDILYTMITAFVYMITSFRIRISCMFFGVFFLGGGGRGLSGLYKVA